MKHLKTLPLTSLFLTLCACTHAPKIPSYWTHPEKALVIIRADHHACAEASLKKYPVDQATLWVKESTVRGRDAQVSCTSYSNTTNCIYSPAIADRHYAGYSVDGKDKNLDARSADYVKCMESKDSRYQCMQENRIVDKYACRDGNLKDNELPAPWVEITADDSSDYYALSLKTDSAAPIKTVLLLEEYSDPLSMRRSTYPYKSGVTTIEINCNSNLHRPIANSKYFAKMGEGSESNYTQYPDREYSEIVPGSVISHLWIAVCRD